LASSPARADSSIISSVAGSSAEAAATGENPDTTCSCTASRKNATPIAPYMISVTTFTAVNTRSRNIPTGTSASGDRRTCTTTNAAPSTTPAISGAGVSNWISP
jgi:hypothetical protein